MPNGDYHGHGHRASFGEIAGVVVLIGGGVLSWLFILLLLLSSIDRTKSIEAKLDRIEHASRQRTRLGVAIARKVGMTEQEIHKTMNRPFDAEYTSGEGF